MKQNRGFAAIWGLIIVAVVLVGGGAFWIKNECTSVQNVDDVYGSNCPEFAAKWFSEETPAETPPPAGTLPPPTQSSVDWNSLLPQIRNILKNSPETSWDSNDPRAQTAVSLSSETDITGDGIKEAIISIPWGGGAASWLVALMRIENNQPILARLKGKDGKISNAVLLEAGSAGYAHSVGLDGTNKSVIRINYGQSNDPNNTNWPYGGYATCDIEVYKWNPNNKLFEWNSSLITQLRDQYCIPRGSRP